METTKTEATSQNQNEKERLELLDKKVEIQKKRVEIKKEQLNIDETIIKRSIGLDEQKTLIDKIESLRNVLNDWTIDDERTIMASEPFLKPLVDGEQREVVLRKMMELIRKF